MKAALPLLAIAAVAGLGLAACDRPFGAAGGDAPSPSTSVAVPDTAATHAPAASALERGTSGMKAVVGDTVTTGKIKAAIASDSGMKDSDVSVSTTQGIVTLSGTVKSREQVTIATNLAQRQEGVSRVESQLTVR